MEFDGFVCIGHRGACGHEPENTLASFQKAIDLGCRWVELDVYAVESELIVIHDKTLERTTNGRGKVMDASLDYLRSLDAGNGQQIPLLSEVIEMIDRRAGINVELKGPDTARPVNELLAHYCDHGWSAEDFLISSFNHAELALADARFRRGALFHKKANYLAAAESLGAWSLNLDLALVSPDLVNEAHDRGFAVLVYTVNEPGDIDRLREMGVDGIFTNYPERVR